MVTARRKSSDRPAPRVSALLGLQKVELFKGLDSASLREIAQQCTWTRYKANVTVIRREEADRAVHFVISGLVRLAAPSARGRTLTLRDVPAGDVFGEHSAIDGRGQFADVLAVRESLVASMSAEAFRGLLASHPTVRERLLRRLAGSVRELGQRLLELGARRVGDRVLGELSRMAYASGILDNSARVERAPHHREIADRVGTGRSEVTRELSRLARQGLIERQRRARVLAGRGGLQP